MKLAVIDLEKDLDTLRIGARSDENYEELHNWEVRLHQNMIPLLSDPKNVTEIKNIMKIIQEAREKARRAGADSTLPSMEARNTVKEMKKQLNRLKTRLGSPALRSSSSTCRGPSGKKSDVSLLFEQLSTLLDDSPLNQEIQEAEFKEIPTIAIYYLDQAIKAYEGSAFGACIAMLGAMLETVMMGTLIRQDLRAKVQSYIACNPKGFHFGAKDPKISKKIVDELDYEKYKNAMQNIFKLPKAFVTADVIQEIRNSIHANKILKNPENKCNTEKCVRIHLGNLNTLIMTLNGTLPD